MGEVSIQDAAFTGFRVVRQHPRALAVWALYALVLSLAFAVILVGLMGPDLATIMAMGARPPVNPEAAMAILGRVAPGYFLFLAVALGFNSVLGAAMIRAVLRPSESRFGFLRLGADELRQLGLAVVTFLLFFGVYLGLIVAITFLGVIVGLGLKVTAGAAIVFGILIVLVAMAFLAVRLSLAPALTFDTRRINLLGSWAMTRGRFWRLFGTYALTFALAAMVFVLSNLVVVALGVVLSGGNMAASTVMPDMTSLRAYFTPFRLIQTVLTAGVSALVWPVLFTPPTAIYQSLAPAGSAAADAFA
jgi:hypothetical protein